MILLQFYGDMMQPGGNDYPLRVKLEEVGGQWVEVQDWKETYKLLVLDDSGIVWYHKWAINGIRLHLSFLPQARCIL